MAVCEHTFPSSHCPHCQLAAEERIEDLEHDQACRIDQASCWFNADGSIERMDPDTVIEKRKAAAKRIVALEALLREWRKESGVMDPRRQLEAGNPLRNLIERTDKLVGEKDK